MATRFYFPTTTASPVTPNYHANWQYTSEALRRMLAYPKGSSSQTNGSQIGPWTDTNLALDRQYVSAPMAAGIVFDTSVTISGQLRVREHNNGDNADRICLSITIWDLAGTSSRRVLLGPAAYGTTLEFVNSTSLTNRIMANGDALAPSTSYTTVDGDRLVVEIGYTNATGVTPEATASWGESEADLTYNNTAETTGSGWIEFSNTITFRTQSLAAASEITGSFVAALSRARPLAAALTTTVDIVAALTKTIVKSFAAALTTTGELVAHAIVGRSIAAASTVTVSIATAISRARPLAANSTITASFVSALARARPFAAASTITASFVSALTGARSMAAASITTVVFVAELSKSSVVYKYVAAQLAVDITLVSALATARPFAAASTITASFVSALAGARPLATALTTTSNVSSSISVSRFSNANAVVTVELSANVTKSISGGGVSLSSILVTDVDISSNFYIVPKLSGPMVVGATVFRYV